MKNRIKIFLTNSMVLLTLLFILTLLAQSSIANDVSTIVDQANNAGADKQNANKNSENQNNQSTNNQSESLKTAPELHKVKMRLSGSGCLSCLTEMENKIKSLKGVEKVEIDYAGQNMYQYYARPDPSLSTATIQYDSSSLSLEQILHLIKSQGYTPYKVVDKSK